MGQRSAGGRWRRPPALVAGGGHGPAGLWARAELRARWRSLVLLGVLAGVTAGLAMAALAGARRTDTAFERLRVATDAADAIVLPSQVGVTSPDWEPLRARPYVRAVAVWDLLFGSIDGGPFAVLFASHDGVFAGEVGRPVVIEGRMYDPSAPGEIVVSESVLDEFPYPVGSTFSFRPYAIDQFDLDGPPQGPEVTMSVVGTVRTVNQFLFTPQALVSPGFVATYGEEALLAQNADVALVDGSADVAALQRDVNELVAEGTPVLDLGAISRRVDTTLAVERAALLLLGAAVAVAGGLLVAQALGRSVSLIAQDALVLRAIGMTRRDLVRAAVGAHLVTVAVAIAAAAATAIGASRFFPVGLGRRVDVDVGTHADWTVLAGGLAITAAGIVAGVVLTAGRASRLTGAGGAHRPSALVAAVRRRAPVAVGLGTSMAFERGHGRASVAVRPALLGAVIGVLGVVATLTIDHGIDDSLAHPERAGVTWDANATLDLTAYAPDGVRPEILDEVLAGTPVGSSAAVVDRQVLDIDGVGAPTFALRALRGEAPIALAVTEGRAPTAVGEVAIGPETARVLGVGVGDTASFSGREVDVVGFALFPSSVHSGFDEGVWVTPEQLELVSPSPELADDYAGSRTLALRFPAGADVGAEVGRMAETLGPTVTELSPVEVPVELENLRNVRALPVFLAGFLALLAVAAVSHVLVSSSRRRRHDFAVMRAIGFTRRGARLTLSAQGTAIGLAGLAVGLPLGVAGGRTGWSWIAARVPLDDVAPVALIAVLLIVPVTVAIVNALAVWPGRAAARIRPYDVLRSE